MIIRATISSPTDALIPNRIVRTKVVTLKFGSGIHILDAPPAGSITGAMLQDGAVTTPKLADEAVTTGKIAKRAVESEQLADGAVVTEKIGPGAVDWDRLDREVRQRIESGGGGQGGGIPENIAEELRRKYNKTGGRISGDVTVGGDLKAERSIRSENDVIADRDIAARRRATANELEITERAAFHGEVRSAGYVQGPTGSGWCIGADGNGEMHSLVLRMFLETPELRKNRISVIGDEFWVSAAGLVESVYKTYTLPVYTGDGRRVTGRNDVPWRMNVGLGYVLRFKLEQGEGHAFKRDDILVSRFEQPAGFQTAWFRIGYVLSEREVFVRPLNGYAPQVAMSVARQGNFTDPERQNSIYIDGRNGYIRVLSGVDSPQIRFENIRCQYGNLDGLTVPGIGALHGYGEYSDNAYKKGVFLMKGGVTVEDFVKEAVEAMNDELAGLWDDFDELNGSLGDLAFRDKVEKALLGDTIISGGYIDTSLINVETLVGQTSLVEKLISSEAFVSKLAASDAFIDKLVVRRLNATNKKYPLRTVQIEPDMSSVVVKDGNGKSVIVVDDGSLDIVGDSEPRIDIYGNSYNGYSDGWTRITGNEIVVSGAVWGRRKLSLDNVSEINFGSNSTIEAPGAKVIGDIDFQGTVKGLAHAVDNVVVSGTVSATEVICENTGRNITLTMPSNPRYGQIHYIHRRGPDGVTLVPASGHTIEWGNGTTGNYTLPSRGTTVRLIFYWGTWYLSRSNW